MALTDIAGDVVQASAAFGGLVLVFLGAASERFHSYGSTQQSAVRAKFQVRAWLALFGAIASLAATATALGAKVTVSEPATIWSLVLLGVAASAVAIAALLTTLDIR